MLRSDGASFTLVTCIHQKLWGILNPAERIVNVAISLTSRAYMPQFSALNRTDLLSEGVLKCRLASRPQFLPHPLIL
jgi:hypothetical protein